LLGSDPGYRAARDEIENLALDHKLGRRRARTGTFLIPVVVHVVSNTPQEDVSFAQIQSQIEALNRDFSAQNQELANLPDPWKPLVGDAGIEFALATEDPTGNATNGVERLQTNVQSFSDDDAVKHADQGGMDAWPSDRYLNLWSCPMQDFLGYAQFPGGPAATDGVVINYQAFGTLGTAAAPFALGRTATHEIGHWLNLLHIWGDDGTGCAGTDNVDDTPNQAGPNTGCPGFPTVTCDNGPNGDMFVNFMDYTDDSCMAMFTAGQVTRMRSVFDGPRSSFETKEASSAGGSASAGGWKDADVTTAAGAPDAAGDPAVVSADGTIRVFYRGTDGHIHNLTASGT